MSRQPSRSRLRHIVTLWNCVNEREGQYQRTVLKYVWVEFRKQRNMLATGDSNADSLMLMVFNGVSLALDDKAKRRRYVPPHVFLSMSDAERQEVWTLNAGDYIGLGIIEGHVSDGGAVVRKDFRINVIDPKFGDSAVVHHWEVSGS